MILQFLNSQKIGFLLEQRGQSLPSSLHGLLILGRANYPISKAIKLSLTHHLFFQSPYSP
ncbi:Uncharacterized protein NCS13_1_1828 [Neochlamydia sp. S13]|nr:Uncharacterized protein NCS13_1_1828 [Neochlamydia sp. S13]